MKNNLMGIILLIFILLTSYQAHPQNVKSIAIFDFVNKNVGKDIDDAAWWIPNLIQSEIIKSDLITVVERANIENVIKEQQLQMSGLIDTRTAIELGKAVGAQKILVGEYQKNKRGRYAVSISFVDVETAKIENQWIDDNLKRKNIEEMTQLIAEEIIGNVEYELALDNLVLLNNPDNPLELEVSCERDTFQLGQIYNFKVKAEEDCYVTIIDIGTSGEITILFPNQMQQDNLIKANKVFETPSVEVLPPTGLERVKFIATKENMHIVDMIRLQNSPKPYLHIPNDEASKFSRDLRMIVTPLKRKDWSAATLKLTIVE